MRQHSDEALQARRVEMEVRLELEKDRSQFLVEPECRIDDHLDRLLFDGEPLDVGDIAAALDRKEEAGWGLIAPGLKTLARRLPVEGVVELDGVEVLRIEGEVLSRRQLLRIEAPAPVRVGPARTTDPNIAGHR